MESIQVMPENIIIWRLIGIIGFGHRGIRCAHAAVSLLACLWLSFILRENKAFYNKNFKNLQSLNILCRIGPAKILRMKILKSCIWNFLLDKYPVWVYFRCIGYTLPGYTDNIRQQLNSVLIIIRFIHGGNILCRINQRKKITYVRPARTAVPIIRTLPGANRPTDSCRTVWTGWLDSWTV